MHMNVHFFRKEHRSARSGRCEVRPPPLAILTTPPRGPVKGYKLYVRAAY